MPLTKSPWLQKLCLLFFSWAAATSVLHAQRLVLAPNPSPDKKQFGPENSSTQILKSYPDGTKKIVPLEALNHHDDGASYGGPPRLSLYQGPTPSPIPSSGSPERLSVAPIGIDGQAANLNASLPVSPDALAGSTQMAAADPMGGGLSGNPMGGGPIADPMGGGGSSAPIDPLGGAGQKIAPPLQTVSGKPAPIVGDTTSLQLGEWESFFLNAGIGGSLQGQLTARRVDNGTNRQAYPLEGNGKLFGLPASGNITAENFTFQPGFRLDVEFGYNFYEWLGVGLQTGLTYNGLQNYTVSANGNLTFPGYGTLSGSGTFTFPADGELVQVPVQLNGILRWPGQVKFRPFIGGGVGAVWQQLDVNTITTGPINVPGNYCRSAFQFGWNAQVGLTYTVEPGLDFYGSFKILSAFMPVIGNYQFENTYNFAVEVGVQSRF